MRRAQLQIGFHWVFALVGGLMFFFFFFILIRSIIGQSEEQDLRELSFAVETIIKTGLANPDTFSVAELSEAEYHFVCTEDSIGISNSYVRINEAEFEQMALRYVPLFTPRTVRGAYSGSS